MNAASFGRILFGASAILFGVIALMWHDAQTWQEVHPILGLPFGTIVGNGLMVAQIAGGIALMFPRTARGASVLLGAVYAVFSLTCVPAIVAHRAVYGSYGSFFEQFSLFCGAVAAYATSETDAARSNAFGRVARIGLGLCAVSFTLAQAFYLQETAQLVPRWVPPNQTFWAVATTVAFALAAIAILTTYRALLALRCMTLMLVLFGIVVWMPLAVAHPQAHLVWSEMALTFLIAGATWLVADASRKTAAAG